MQFSLTGRLLIATPSLEDPRFSRAIIYVCAHDEDHAMGVVVNRPANALTLPDMLKNLGIEATINVPPKPVLNGGPCDQERGFVLHTSDYFSEDATLMVGGGISLTATKDVLSAIANSQTPKRSVLALGYAGWSAGQLESEIHANAWIVGEGDHATVFGDNHDAKWARALGRLGIDPGLLSPEIGHA
jgi:putative transcriptional regulator